MTQSIFSRMRATAAVLTLSACYGDPSVSVTTQEIHNGTTATAAEAEQNGIVTINGYTGVMIRNEWLLTSMYAINFLPRLDPTTLTVTMGTQSAQVRSVHMYSMGLTTTFMMLVRLQTPLTVAGQSSGFQRTLSGLSPSYGGQVTCWGRSSEAGPIQYGTSYATLNTSNNDLSFNPSDPRNTQYPETWDGGGPCFNPDGSLAALVVDHAHSTARALTAEIPWIRTALGELPAPNDTRATALRLEPTMIGRNSTEVSLSNNTLFSTHDGPSVPCGCTGGPDIWYRFDLSSRAIVYLDTSGSDYDTSILVTNASGAPVAAQSGFNTNLGLCNDDGSCNTGGFTSAYQSRTAGILEPGTYYAVIGGCGAGHVVVHYQYRYLQDNNTMVSEPIAGTNARFGATSTSLNSFAPSCGASPSTPDEGRWFVTCGGLPQFFSLCQSDGASYRRRYSSTWYDPVMAVNSAALLIGSQLACNDDGAPISGSNCAGVGGDSAQYGSRIPSVVTPRGLNWVSIEDRNGSGGMDYLLSYRLQ